MGLGEGRTRHQGGLRRAAQPARQRGGDGVKRLRAYETVADVDKLLLWLDERGASERGLKRELLGGARKRMADAHVALADNGGAAVGIDASAASAAPAVASAAAPRMHKVVG